MADNSLRTPGVGETIRTEDKAGAKTQVVIIDSGGSGAEDIAAGIIIRDGGNVITVDGTVAVSSVGGTVTVSGTVDTELPAAAALTDNFANPTAPGVGAFGMLWDGATWDRRPGNSTDGTLVNLGANNDVTVTSGAVTADTELPAAAALSADNVAAPTAPAVGAFNFVYDGTSYDRMRGDSTDGVLVNLGANNDVAVTGAVTANAGTGPFPVSDNGGSLTVDAPVGTPANVQVGDGTNTATVRNLAANDALNVAIVDGAGAHITSFGGGTQFAEDAIHTTGDVGTMALAVRKDATGPFGADGDYSPLQLDANGHLKVAGGGGGTQFAVDAAHTTGDLGTMALGVTKAADGAMGGDLDYAPLQFDASGFLKVNVKAGAGTGGTAMVDDAAFTVGATSVTPIGAMFDDTATDSVDEGDVGVVRMTANRMLMVSDGGGSLTVDGTVTADTELPAAAALSADNVASPTAPAVGAFAHYFDGTNWDRARGDSTDGALVNLGANNDVVVTGNITTVTTVSTVSAVSAITPGTGATNLGKAEDAIHATGDVGVMALAVRADTAAATGANGDYLPLLVDANGRLHTADAAELVDDAAFTPGTSLGIALFGFADETSTDTVNEGDIGAVRMTVDRQLRVAAASAPTATLANVGDSATSVTVLAANVARKGAIIVNDSTAILYLKFGATASTTSYTYKIDTMETLEIPGGPVVYTGIIDGIWASDAGGNARVTELT